MSNHSISQDIDTSHKKSTLEMPYLAVIPYSVLSDNKLKPNAKILYGCLAGLSKKEGYCWATNEQLAEMFVKEETAIKRWLDDLETKNFIRRISENISYRDSEGKLLWKCRRKIYVTEGFSNKVCEGGQKAPVDEGGEKAPVDEGGQKAPVYKESISKQSIKKKEKNAPTPSPKAQELCVYQLKRIREKSPEYREPNMSNWAKEVDRMMRIDQRSYEQVKRVIDWIFDEHEPWYANNVLSPTSLRKQFDKILRKIANPAKPNVSYQKKSNAYKNPKMPYSSSTKYPGEPMKYYDKDDREVDKNGKPLV